MGLPAAGPGLPDQVALTRILLRNLALRVLKPCVEAGGRGMLAHISASRLDSVTRAAEALGRASQS